MRTKFRIFLVWLALFVVLSSRVIAADGAGPALKVETAKGVRAFQVELATSPSQQAMGLMFRRSLAPNAGMLFVYPAGTRVTMWMKNTLIPLDMVFIASDDRISHIVERTVPESTELIGSDGPVRAVLELNAGTVSRLGIKVGDRVDHPALQ